MVNILNTAINTANTAVVIEKPMVTQVPVPVSTGPAFGSVKDLFLVDAPPASTRIARARNPPVLSSLVTAEEDGEYSNEGDRCSSIIAVLLLLRAGGGMGI